MFTLDNVDAQCLEVVGRHVAKEFQGRALRGARLGQVCQRQSSAS